MTTNIQLAKRIARHVQLDTVVLRRADLTADFDPYNLPADLALTQGYRCSYEANDHSQNGRISVVIDFKFSAKKVEEGEPGEDVVSLDASFLLVYSIDKSLELDPECLTHFASVNGPYNVWPYWREFVQTATGRVGLPGVTVPVFRPEVQQVDDKDCLEATGD